MKAPALAGLFLVAISCTVEHRAAPECGCDTTKLKSTTLSSAKEITFYEVDAKTNQQLWFADIESIDSTRYTRLWDDYHENNFRTSHQEFKDHYKQLPNTELAFQIGPAGPLWTYYTFVLMKRECCFVFTRTSFAHARFRYKGYSFPTQEEVDSLRSYITMLDKIEVDNQERYMTASFIDNTNDEVFDVAIENPHAENPSQENSKSVYPDSSVIKLLAFIDDKIKWKETYPLEAKKPEKAYPKFRDQFLISGDYLIEAETGSFRGQVAIEKRESYMFYSWSISSAGGKLLAAKSSTIDFEQISNDDYFGFVRKRVVQEIKEYKIKGRKIVTEITETDN